MKQLVMDGGLPRRELLGCESRAQRVGAERAEADTEESEHRRDANPHGAPIIAATLRADAPSQARLGRSRRTFYFSRRRRA